MKLANHESADVRVQALTRLQQTLKEQQRALQEHISVTAAVGLPDSTLSSLVATLLHSCRDKLTQLLAAKCLGLLAAIDPDRYTNERSQYSTVFRFFVLL